MTTYFRLSGAIAACRDASWAPLLPGGAQHATPHMADMHHKHWSVHLAVVMLASSGLAHCGGGDEGSTDALGAASGGAAGSAPDGHSGGGAAPGSGGSAAGAGTGTAGGLGAGHAGDGGSGATAGSSAGAAASSGSAGAAGGGTGGAGGSAGSGASAGASAGTAGAGASQAGGQAGASGHASGQSGSAGVAGLGGAGGPGAGGADVGGAAGAGGAAAGGSGASAGAGGGPSQCPAGGLECADELTPSVCGEDGEWHPQAPCNPMTPCIAGQCQRPTQVSVGQEFACARMSLGGVLCWGNNTFSQLGAGSGFADVMSLKPLPVVGISKALSLVTGGVGACVLGAPHQVYCWGGELFYGFGGLSSAKALPGWGEAAQVTLGCVLDTSGVVRCVGSNHNGDVGDGTTQAHADPTIALVPSATRIATGWGHHCAVVAGGAVWCWGDNEAGEVGQPLSSAEPTPIQVPGLAGVAELAAGAIHTCAVRDDGTVWCWGGNLRGQLGDGTFESHPEPAQVPISGVVKVAAGPNQTCAILAGGSVACWGELTYIGPGGNVPVPQLVDGLDDVLNISVGDPVICAVKKNGTVVCLNGYPGVPLLQGGVPPHTIVW